MGRSEAPGSYLGRYRILERIGEGGFGMVYVAEQREPVRRKVALKVLKPGMDSREVLARFEAERQALAMMDHPNVAKVFDAGMTEAGRPYFAMEHVAGVPITAYADAAKLPTRARVELFIPVCHAVQHAHQKGIIHRDLKPSNILVALFDGKPVPKVIDFGIAKALHAPLTDHTLYTEAGRLIGTPEYISPEQAQSGGLDIDTRTDIYSLGIILYQLLTGTLPFDPGQLRGAGMDAMVRMIRELDPPKPSTRLSTLLSGPGSLAPVAPEDFARRHGGDPRSIAGDLKGDLDWIVVKAIDKERSRRYASASDVAADLCRHLNDEPVVAGPPRLTYKIGKFVRRYRVPVAATAAVLLTLVASLVVITFLLSAAVRARNAARDAEQRVAHERDDARDAKKAAENSAKDATEQRGIAVAAKGQAEAQSRRAQSLYAQGLISNGDALTTAGEFRNAYAAFEQARQELDKAGESLERLDISLTRLHKLSPPPLWTTSLDDENLYRWVLLPARDELVWVDNERFGVLNLLTGKAVRRFGEAAGVRCLAVAESPQGPVLIAGRREEVVAVSLETGEVLRRAGDGRAGRQVCTSPDGSVAASLDAAGTLTLWDVATLDVRGRVAARNLRSPAFSPDGNRLACLDAKPEVVVFDTRDGSEVATLPIPEGARGAYAGTSSGVTSLAFDSDGASVFCGESDGRVISVSPAGPVRVVAHPHEGTVNSLTLTPDGRRLIACGIDGTIRLVEKSPSGDWAPTVTLVQPAATRISAQFVRGAGAKACSASRGSFPLDDGVVVAVGPQGQVNAWPLRTPQPRPGSLREALAFSPDGLLVTGRTRPEPQRRVEVRDVATGRTLRSLDVSDDARGSAFTPDSGGIYIGLSGALLRFDLSSGRTTWAVRAHDRPPVTALTVSPDGRFVATGAMNEGVARVWDAADGRLLHALGGLGDSVYAACFVPLATGEKSPAPSGRLIVGPGGATFIVDWRFEAALRPRRADAGFTRGLTFAPDGRTVVVTGGSNGKIDLVDAETFRSVGALGPVGTITYNFAFLTPGGKAGRWGASQGRNDIRVWDVPARREELVLLRGVESQATNTLAGAPDGTMLCLGGVGLIDFTLAGRVRRLETAPDAAARAELYGRLGLWGWARRLLRQEADAGHPTPVLLRARAEWMCGDYDAARAGFARAAAAGLIPQAYAELCASVADEPRAFAPGTVAERGPDPVGAWAGGADELSPDALPASDLDRLRAAYGQTVVVEGRVSACAWSSTGKVMNIHFADARGAGDGMVAIVFGGKREEFDHAFGGDAAAAFAGSRLRVSGKIDRYGGFATKWQDWPQIILSDPSQVTVLK